MLLSRCIDLDMERVVVLDCNIVMKACVLDSHAFFWQRRGNRQRLKGAILVEFCTFFWQLPAELHIEAKHGFPVTHLIFSSPSSHTWVN
ncbi:unnamed protein product [Thelazia callipaeda]|uniref:PINc domain-containing protein n=1 Tax=Thelazia callipaeda TaxID=103827 RepID=A0A0N5CS69_THECL|nr:unnamed protein product [Thelazia callipaeda]